MKQKHKTYSKPKRPFDKTRIDEEKEIKKEFGLKNKKEIWKADAKIKSIREKAKKLISAEPEEQKKLFKSLKKIGLEVNSIADVLSLDKKDYLQRRLQTVILNKKIAKTIKEARQLITHKKVIIRNKIVDSPSYIVPLETENKIKLKVKSKKVKKQEIKPLASSSEIQKDSEQSSGLAPETKKVSDTKE